MNWTGVIVAGGGVSTLYSTNDLADAQDFIDGIETFLVDISDRLNSNLAWQCEADVDEINVGTGEITAQTTVTTTPHAGTDSSEALPWATQGLIRARTGVFSGGREIRGRMFIPAFTEAQSSGGLPSSACRSDVNTAVAVLANSTSAGWAVYSRTHHTVAGVSAATMWEEWAVLRSRRD